MDLTNSNNNQNKTQNEQNNESNDKSNNKSKIEDQIEAKEENMTETNTNNERFLSINSTGKNHSISEDLSPELVNNMSQSYLKPFTKQLLLKMKLFFSQCN
jgi:hypothetical protein